MGAGRNMFGGSGQLEGLHKASIASCAVHVARPQEGRRMSPRGHVGHQRTIRNFSSGMAKSHRPQPQGLGCRVAEPICRREGSHSRTTYDFVSSMRAIDAALYEWTALAVEPDARSVPPPPAFGIHVVSPSTGRARLKAALAATGAPFEFPLSAEALRHPAMAWAQAPTVAIYRLWTVQVHSSVCLCACAKGMVAAMDGQRCRCREEHLSLASASAAL